MCIRDRGNAYTLPSDSYPLKDLKEPPWYAGFCPHDPMISIQNPVTNLPQGFLFPEEVEALYNLSHDKNVLEMGAYKGRSTVCMAQSAKSVTSIDWHRGDMHVDVGDSTWDEYLNNIKDYKNVTPIKGRFEDEIPKLSGQSFDMVFVDGQHDKESVIRDMGYAMSFNPEVIAVHDYGHFEVNEGLKELGLMPSQIINTLAVFEMSKKP
jgi:hypothetical protein